MEEEGGRWEKGRDGDICNSVNNKSKVKQKGFMEDVNLGVILRGRSLGRGRAFQVEKVA